MVRLTTGPVASWLTQYATGWGGIPFQMQGTGQWSRAPLIPERQIPGSNATIRQFLGLGSWKVSYDLLLATVDDLSALIALQGTDGDLLVLPDTAAVATRVAVVIGGRLYDRIPNATLTGVDSAVFVRGGAKCSASFAVEGP